MKLIYIHQHFVTTIGSSGTRSYDVSKHLVKMGHQVTIICGLHDQSGLRRMPWWLPFRIDWFEGFKVVVCNVPYSNKMSILRRLWSMVGFAFLASWAAVWERGCDVVLSTSPPLEVVIPGFLSSRLHRVPFLFEVRDLWPEDLVDAGRFKKNAMAPRLQGVLERFGYRAASRILLVSRGYHERLLDRGYPEESLRTIVLGADGGMFTGVRPDEEYLKRIGLEGKFVGVYAGAHGVANGLDQLLDAAEHLRSRSDIAMLLIGEGKKKRYLIQQVDQRQLANVHIQDAVPKTRLPGILLACDVGLLILSQACRPRWVTPNKLFDYMFAGLPTIVNFAGTTAELLLAERTGLASQPGSAEDLAAKIRYYADHREDLEATGRRAQQISRERYDRSAVAEQLADVFEAARNSRIRQFGSRIRANARNQCNGAR